MPDPKSEMSPVKRALAEIRRLRARVDDLERASAEPIAIIGMGLRLPGGATDEASFWALLREGRDAIREIPPERWDWRSWDEPGVAGSGSGVSRFGGFINEPEAFDAGFFGIAPREAVMMDPQHRLALEIAWEALENGGYGSPAIQGSATGIFLGIGNSDYGRHIFRDAAAMDAYAGSGNSPAMVAGRLSYVLGLHGPAVAIDTSCSSSLVAVHEACASLRAGECTMALAGGVNLMLLPEAHVALSRAQMMAPDGRCKTFDDAANGYVRGEGGGIVVLKRLSAAVADGDRIVAVIRGSAVNHDGRSGGLTAPSGPAQTAVIRKAAEAAGVPPAAIGFVETHGTGTALGDPIEVEALASVLCEGRDAGQPLLLGALKTNLGHLEAASGVAGLIKAVLVLEHRTVPANLHLKKKNTRIPWERLNVVVPTANTPWDARYAGVSSFGFSGTNAHVILERAPEKLVEENVRERPWHVLAISAKSEASLEKLRVRYGVALRNGEGRLADVCFTAHTGRTHFEHRWAVVAQTAEEMSAGLEGSEAVRRFTGAAEGEPGRIGFLFTGQGSQYAGMGRELYENSAVYREAVERCSAIWQELTGVLLAHALYGGGELKEAREAQPALFALEYGLAELWRSWGVEPALVLGHSLGEYVAAVVAGLLTLEDGLRLVHARAELMDRLAARGGMRAVAADVERVLRALAGWEGEVAIAAVNGPASVVISGSVEGLKAVAGKLEAEGVRTRELDVSHAFHSPLLEPVLDEFEERASQVSYGKLRVRIVSNLTGRVAAAEEMGRARYWREHMRQTVQFHAGLETALAAGCTTFIEIGPQPHLRAIAAKTDAGLGERIRVSMTRNASPYAQMCESLAQLYVEGQPVNWAGFDRGWRRSRVALPTYPFERQRYWHGPKGEETAREVWRRASEGAAARAQFVPMEMKVEAFPEKWDALKKLTVAQMLATLGELKILAEPGQHDPDALLARAGVVPSQHRLMRRWLSLLADEGYLSWSATRIVIPARIHAPDLPTAWRDAEAQLREDPYLGYLRNCAALLRPVLLGQASALETLFPGGSPELATNLYERSPGARYANAIVAEAVQAAAMAVPGGRKLRVLEIGGGTGATMASVLPRLTANGASYRFTDVSEQFLRRAAERFAGCSFLRYGLLDIENESHLRAHRQSCDVLIAANVVHATQDLERTLERLRDLVAPGGTAILVETTKSFVWHEITIGLVEGWQKSGDALRGGATLMEANAWDRALRAAGFVAVAQAPATGSPAEAAGLHVLLAQAPFGECAEEGSPAAIEAWYPETVAEVAHKDSGPSMAERLAEAPSAERREIVLGVVLEEIAQVLRLPSPGAVRKRDRLMEIGLDSLMALDLSRRLATLVGIAEMPATLMFDYPTPEAIAVYLLGRLGLDEREGDGVERGVAVPVSGARFSAEEVDEMPDEAVAELLRGRLER
ncbi:MAG TPA: beta-ketoacyl synthase N-terminal-like domain-containing protein [Acidobacteriaceae bacterium]|nr:beta-ketoacyl synthase N-terminal-like domain-containing protein [Acidobacteriaceae bacterium]